MKRNIHPFERRLRVSACALVALAWSLFLLDQWVAYSFRMTEKGERAVTLAMAIEQRVLRSIRVTDQMLTLVRSEILEQGAWRDKSRLEPILARLTPSLEEVFAVAFISAEGISLALSTPAISAGRSHTDRDFFQFHAATHDDELFIGRPFVLPATGNGVFTLSRAVRNEHGILLGIVVTVLRTEILAKEFSALRIGSNGSLGVHHLTSHLIIARQPAYEATAATDIGHDQLMSALNDAPHGVFRGEISSDNEPRLFAYRKLPRHPLAVTVGIALEDIHAEMWRDLTGHFVTMLMLTALMAVGTRFLCNAYRRELTLEEDLANQERFLGAFFETIPAGVATLDRDMRYQLVNPAMATLNGKRLDDYAGKTVQEAHPTLATKIAPFHRRVFEAGASYRDVEFTGQRHDGTEAVGHWNATFFPIRNDTGVVTMMGCFVVDITTQKSTEIELRKSEVLLSTVLDALPVGVCIADRHGSIVRSNPTSQRLWGGACSRQEPDDPHTVGSLHGEKISEINGGALADALRSGQDTVGHLQDIVCASGERRSVKTSVLTLRSQDGAVAGAIMVTEDVTEIHTAQEELRVSRDYFESLFKDAPVGMGIVDRDGRLLRVNHAMTQFTGYTEDELLKMSFLDYGHPDDRALNLRIRDELVSGRALSLQKERRYVRKDGTVVWGLSAVTAICDKEGNPVQAIGQVLDIDRLITVERALKESRKTLRALSSHQTQLLETERKHIAQELHDELGQLLTALKMEISLLRIAHGESTQIVSKAEQMQLLVDQTIAVIRHVSSNLRPPALDLGLMPAIEWLSEDFSSRWGITCHFETDVDEPNLDDAVATTIFRVIQESLTNIARYAKANVAAIRVRQTESQICFYVTDDGCGFDLNLVDLRKSFGILGMRERLLAAGGNLSVESAPGAGTTVCAVLPTRREDTQ